MKRMPSSADRLKRLRAKLHTAMRADRVILLRDLGKLRGDARKKRTWSRGSNGWREAIELPPRKNKNAKAAFPV